MAGGVTDRLGSVEELIETVTNEKRAEKTTWTGRHL